MLPRLCRSSAFTRLVSGASTTHGRIKRLLLRSMGEFTPMAGTPGQRVREGSGEDERRSATWLDGIGGQYWTARGRLRARGAGRGAQGMIETPTLVVRTTHKLPNVPDAGATSSETVWCSCGCGEEFSQTAPGGHQRRFYSPACKALWHRRQSITLPAPEIVSDRGLRAVLRKYLRAAFGHGRFRLRY